MSKVCTLLVGVPASGKSTWIKQQHLDDYQYDDTIGIVSTDLVIETIAELYDMTYDECFRDLISFAEKVMWEDLEIYATQGLSIYIDRTNLSVKSRKKFIDFLEPYGYRVEAMMFPIPEKEEWDRRLNMRKGKTIPFHVLESMVKNYQEPSLDEGFFCINSI